MVLAANRGCKELGPSQAVTTEDVRRRRKWWVSGHCSEIHVPTIARPFGLTAVCRQDRAALRSTGLAARTVSPSAWQSCWLSDAGAAVCGLPEEGRTQSALRAGLALSNPWVRVSAAVVGQGRVPCRVLR